MNKTLSSLSKIRFQDCDPFNHLNNSRYIDYLINAREDQILENYQLDMYRHIKEYGCGWVVGSNQITYLKPALLMEEVLIDSQLLHYNPHSVTVEIRMWDKNQTHLKAVMWSKFTYFDVRTQKKANHPEYLMELFEKVVNPVDQRSFEERCYSFVQQLKEVSTAQ